MQKRNLIVIAVAAAIGLIAVILANSWFSGKEEEQQATARRMETVPIVVASAPLTFGTQLSTQNVRLQQWPAEAVPAGAFRTMPEALKNDRVALRSIVPGEPILASSVTGTTGRATLAALLPPGMRAASIAVNDVRGVSGFVLPGTLVDVILTRNIQGDGATSDDMRSDVVLENVRVLAIDQVADDKVTNPKVARTATLAVTLRDAQRLALAEKIGTLSLVLRRLEDATNGTAPGSQLITTRDVTGPKLIIQGRPAMTGAPVTSAAMGVIPPPIPAIGASGIMAPPAYTGPSMTVVRGVEATSYPIGPVSSQTRGK